MSGLRCGTISYVTCSSCSYPAVGLNISQHMFQNHNLFYSCSCMAPKSCLQTCKPAELRRLHTTAWGYSAVLLLFDTQSFSRLQLSRGNSVAAEKIYRACMHTAGHVSVQLQIAHRELITQQQSPRLTQRRD